MKIEDREDGLTLILEKEDLVDLKDHFMKNDFVPYATSSFVMYSTVTSTSLKHDTGINSTESVMTKLERLVKLCV